MKRLAHSEAGSLQNLPGIPARVNWLRSLSLIHMENEIVALSSFELLFDLMGMENAFFPSLRRISLRSCLAHGTFAVKPKSFQKIQKRQ